MTTRPTSFNHKECIFKNNVCASEHITKLPICAHFQIIKNMLQNFTNLAIVDEVYLLKYPQVYLENLYNCWFCLSRVCCTSYFKQRAVKLVWRMLLDMYCTQQVYGDPTLSHQACVRIAVKQENAERFTVSFQTFFPRHLPQ